MAKYVSFVALFVILFSCNNSNQSGSSADAGKDDTKSTTLDTTKNADGITNNAVISTDTAAMNINNSKGKAAK